MSDASPTCPVCGAVLEGHAPGGLCPKCLMEAAVGESYDSEEPSPGGEAVAEDHAQAEPGLPANEWPEAEAGEESGSFIGRYKLLEKLALFSGFGGIEALKSPPNGERGPKVCTTGLSWPVFRRR